MLCGNLRNDPFTLYFTQMIRAITILGISLIALDVILSVDSLKTYCEHPTRTYPVTVCDSPLQLA